MKSATATYTISSSEARVRNRLSAGIFLAMLAVGLSMGYRLTQTQRDIREEQLRADRESLRAEFIVASDPQAIIMCDGEGHIVMANHAAEQLFGWTKPELIGKHSTILVPEDKKPELLAEIEEAAVTMRGYDGNWLMMLNSAEFSAVHKDGSTVHVDVQIRVIKFLDEVQFIVALNPIGTSSPNAPHAPVPLPEISNNVSISRATQILKQSTEQSTARN